MLGKPGVGGNYKYLMNYSANNGSSFNVNISGYFINLCTDTHSLDSNYEYLINYSINNGSLFDIKIARYFLNICIDTYSSYDNRFNNLEDQQVVDNITNKFKNYLFGSPHNDLSKKIDIHLIRSDKEYEIITNGYIAVAEFNEDIIMFIIFRGTYSGFITSSLKIQDKLKNIITIYLKKNKKMHIFLSGHSLGGAVATLSSYHLMNHFKEIIGSKKMNIITYVFGSPKIGTRETFVNKFNEFIDKKYIAYFNISHCRDPIFHFPKCRDYLECTDANKYYHTKNIIVINAELIKNPNNKENPIALKNAKSGITIFDDCDYNISIMDFIMGEKVNIFYHEHYTYEFLLEKAAKQTNFNENVNSWLRNVEEQKMKYKYLKYKNKYLSLNFQ